MAIKISKVIADLNVGRQTIEEFLHKKGIEIDASINARIQDDVYEMLVKEFKPDMDLKSKSDKMANERQKEKAKQNAAAKESHEIKTVIPGQKPKVLGKIDLDAAGKPKSASKSEAKVEEPKPVEDKTQEPQVEAKTEEKHEKKSVSKPEPSAKKKGEEKEEISKPVEELAQPTAADEAEVPASQPEEKEEPSSDSFISVSEGAPT